MLRAPVLAAILIGSVAPPSPTYAPVVAGGMTFPVARTSWMSVIEFDHDWHAPRMRLVDGRWQQVGVHEGLDISAEPGTPVLSMSDGTIEAIGWTFYSGNRVGIRGTDGRYYFYAHLSGFADLRVGDTVSAGTPIGKVGNTGYGPPGHEDEFPPHLHLGIRADDWIDPYPLVARLYRRSVRATTRLADRISVLRRAGDEAAAARLEERLFADPEPFA